MDAIEAVREFRRSLGWSQQRFATELGISIRAVVNYEKDRIPNAPALARLETLATEHRQPEFAYVFTRALGDQLGIGRANRGPLNSKEERLREAFERCVIQHAEREDAKQIADLLQPYVDIIDKEWKTAIALLEHQNTQRKRNEDEVG